MRVPLPSAPTARRWPLNSASRATVGAVMKIASGTYDTLPSDIEPVARRARRHAVLHEADVDVRVRVRQPLEFCSEPSEGSTFNVMRLRARISLYFCAAFQKVLPSGCRR